MISVTIYFKTSPYDFDVSHGNFRVVGIDNPIANERKKKNDYSLTIYRTDGKQNFKAKIEFIDSENGDNQEKTHIVYSKKFEEGQRVFWQFKVPERPYFKRISVELIYDN
ncbi:unnamed protein product [Oikopleura dioica]|uniref:Uncharacterized protein n=1 Tax=Oikopleura dioica TaxID=34765 RepID=E4Y5T6_OIKDI|nr:unnamed protein product [Oikopleura dioica]